MSKQNFRFNDITGVLEPVVSSAPEVKIDQSKLKSEKINLISNGNQLKPNVPTDENIIQFREMSDYSVFQIVDEQNGHIMAYIGGYGLDISFNMKELSSINKVEQCLEGLKKLFRNLILEQRFGKED